MSKFLRTIWQLLRGFTRTVLALLILFEEWGWEPLARLMARIGRWPVIRQLERLIGRLPPYAALALLLLPTLALLPVKLLALWLIGMGRAGLGLLLILLAKLVGTAVLAWLFALTRPALLRLAWFARLHARWMRWKAQLLDWVRGSGAWRWARAFRRRARRCLRRRRGQ